MEIMFHCRKAASVRDVYNDMIKNTKGFTLIEIMIVVGIIAMLATIAIPSLLKNSSTAKMQTCISNLHNIELSIQQWSLDTRQSETAPVTGADILPYLQGTIVCPSGGRTFSDSYCVTAVNVKPTCLKVPNTHKLPENTIQ